MQITHPFHPLYGHRLELLRSKRSRFGDRLWLRGSDGGVLTVPAAWTDQAPIDAFSQASKGRSRFRPDDLIAVVAMVDALRAARTQGGCGV